VKNKFQFKDRRLINNYKHIIMNKIKVNYKINYYFFIILYGLILFLISFKVFNIPITHDEIQTTVYYSNFSVWQIMMYPDNWPNNHILNTILTKGFILIFGANQWVVRTPNVLSFLLYAFAIFRINKIVLKKDSLFFIPAAILFIANPYLLDFFGLCRGYGISCALCTLSISYLISGYKYLNNKNIWLAFGLSILASYANFTLLVFWVATTMLTWFYFVGLFRIKREQLLKPTLIIFISSILYLLLIATPIYKMQSSDQFQYWNSPGFYSATILSLVDLALYGTRRGFHGITDTIAILSIIILIINCIYIFIKGKKSKFEIQNICRPVFIATTIIILTAGINYLQCKILNTPNLTGRTALFFYPMFIIAFVTTLGLFEKLKIKTLKIALSVFITAICLLHLADTMSLKSVREWWYDENTFKVLNYLKTTNKDKTVSMQTNWLFNPSFYFYKYTGKAPWLDLKYYDKNIELNTDAEYYYVMEEDFITLAPKFEPVLKFDNGCWLLKKRQANDTINKQTGYDIIIKEKMKQIYKDEKWLNTVKEKAKNRGISLDSMVYLDAKWMLDSYGK